MKSIESDPEAHPGWRSFGPELLILLGGAVFALLGRGRWANVTEDHGFWFSAAQSMLKGGRALREVRLQYGPGSLWILDGACRLFGATASTLVVLQFAVGLSAILGVQLFSRLFLSPIERWMSASTLVVLIVWMVGPGNLLYPCAFAISQALLLALAAIAIAVIARRRDSLLCAALAGMLAGATFLTKQEFGLAAVWGIAAVTLLQSGLLLPRKARLLGSAGLGFLSCYAGVLLFASRGDSIRHLLSENLLWPWVPVPAPWRALYVRLLGLDRPFSHLVEAADALVAILVVGGAIWLILYGRQAPQTRRVLSLLVPFGGLVWLWRWSEGSHFLPMTLCLPALLAAGFRCARIGRLPPSGEAAETPGAYWAILGAAILLLQREGYRGEIEGYYSGMGYVLAIPAVVPLIWSLARGPRRDGRRSLVAGSILLCIVASFGGGRLRALERRWNDMVAFSTARGTVYLPKTNAPAFEATARFITENSRPGDPILILPATSGLDFLLDRQNLSFFPYVSPGFLTETGERELIERCRRMRPRAVVIFEHTLGVLRSGDFGSGFAEQLSRWLEAQYPREVSNPQGWERHLLAPIGAAGSR